MRLGTYYRYGILRKLALDNKISTQDSWLDIGCHDGFILESIYSKRRVGIDIEPKKRGEIEIVKASVEYLPFKDGVFQVITALDIIEHIKKDFNLIFGVERKLAKNGLFILTTPHKDARILPAVLEGWLIFKRWGHIRRGYDIKILKRLFKGPWILKFLHWNTDVLYLIYFPLQLLWRFIPKFAKEIINKVIEIEFIRTRKLSTRKGHIILIAKKL